MDMESILKDYKININERANKLLRSDKLIEAAHEIKMYGLAMKLDASNRKYMTKYRSALVRFQFLIEQPREIDKYIDHKLAETNDLLFNYEADNEADYAMRMDLQYFCEKNNK